MGVHNCTCMYVNILELSVCYLYKEEPISCTYGRDLYKM